ncbi:MAG: response regulator [Opitutaceae bacterium]|jgi:signal transduction histidine kinase/two-component SAPR family response regulator
MKALNVDDKDENLYFLETVLRASGFEVVNAHNGVEALEYLNTDKFDLIVSDVLMPQMDGFQFCREVRRRPELAKVPFVFYTGSYTDMKDAELAMRLGATRYLLKPMEPHSLADVLRDIMDQAAKTPAAEPPLLSDETDYLRSYSERLVRKLEEKVEQYDALSNRLQTAFDEKVKEVSERLHVEDTLRLNEERYRAVVGSLAEGILLVEKTGQIVACNDSASLILKVPQNEILVSSLDQMLWRFVRDDGTDIRPSENPIRLCLDTGRPFDHIVVGMPSLEKPTIWLSANVRPCIKEIGGSILMAVMSFTDITEKRLLEEKFLRTQRLESIGILAGGVAHDLNNILAPILLAIPIVRMRVEDAQGLMLLDTIEASATRGAQVVRQILSFSRGLRTEKMTIQARHLLKEIAEITQETFPRNISIETDLPRTLWQVEADTTQLHQVFMNLCVNARDAMPKGGNLTLQAENAELRDADASQIPGSRPGHFVKISISDTGTGMPPDVLARLFEPFFTTKDPGHGTGLGLSTARSIVKQHEGFITVDSKPGAGSRFDVYLPGILSEEEDTPVMSRHLPHGSGELILVVDDEFALRHISESLLTAHDYRVITADSGQQGLALMRENQQDVAMAITDLVMPGMSGAELIPMLRGMKPSLKIVAISGTVATAGDAHAPPGVIVDAFLNKPFAAEELLLVVHEVLAEKK